ncbi:MAG: PAS domain S-box protein [Candidatus Coatesbacteria bacterium]|nr:MAG: PAS domain S-box protein [Candidatus Coatesbacteria bacterium]
MGLKRADILNGWKEISGYLGCSVATAIRRERDGLPVFRSGGQVRAFNADIDKWLKGLRATEVNSIAGSGTVDEIEETKDLSGVLATLLRRDDREKLAVIRIGKDVAEFERIEVQLKSAEEKYRNLVEEIPEWIWEVDADGEFVYSSPGVLEILGYEPEELVGFTAEEFLVHPDDRSKYRTAVGRLTGQKEIVHGFLCRYIHREGSVRHIETSASPVFNASGDSACIKGISRDVTDRIRLEGKITETRRYLENVLQGSMDAIITTDIDGRVVTWNRGAEAIYGYSKEEAFGKYIDKLINPRGESRDFRELFLIIEEKGGWYAEEPIERHRKDGTTLYASASYSIVHGADGNPVGICAITRDITDRLNAERFTREALSRFESVFENVPNVAVQGFGPDGKIRHWNPAAEQIFDYSSTEVIGERAETLTFLNGEDHAGFKDDLDRIFASGETGEPKEFSFARPDGGRRWVYSQMFPVFVEGKVEEVFQMSVDITDRKQTEDVIRNAAKEWRKTFDTIPDLIAIIDDDCRILRLNKAMAEKIGVEPKEALGAHCYEALNGADEPCDFCPHVRVPLDERERKIEAYFKKLDRYYEVYVSPVNDAEGKRMGAVHIARDITERKRAEEALLVSEERFKELAELLPQTVFEIDIEGNFTYVNQCGFESSGYTQKDVDKGFNAIQLFIPEDRERVKLNIEKRLRGEETEYSEYTVRRKDGSTFPVVIYSSSIIRGEKSVGLRGVAFNITERKRAEEALRESEEKYRSLFEDSPTSITLVDRSGVIIDCNRYTEELIGYRKEGIIGKRFEELTTLNAGDLPVLREKFGDLLKGKAVEPYELEITRKNGEKRWINVIDSLLMKDGEVTGFQIISMDVTERKRAEEALRESEERYKKISSNLPKGAVHIMDKDFRYVFSDGEVLREIGLPDEELAGKSIYDVLPPDIAQMVAENYKRVIGGESVTFEGDFAGRTFLCNAVPLEGPDGERDQILVLSTDISDHVRAEKSLKESEEKYRSLVEQAIDGIAIIQDGRFLFANRAAARMLGYTPDELAGTEFTEIVVPEVHDELVDRYRRRIAGENVPPIYETKLLRRDGATIDVEINAGVFDYNGRPADLAFARDIRERKRAEDLSRIQHGLSEALNVTSNLNDALALCTEAAIQAGGMDSGGVYLVDEENGDLNLVYSKGLLSDFVKSASHYSADSPSARLIKAGKPVYSVHQELGVPLDEPRRNEGLRAIAVLPIFYEGKIIACMNVASHVTDEVPISARNALETIAAQIGGVFTRIRVQEALKESEDKYRNLVETVEEGIGIIDVAENLTFVNKAFAEALGYTVEELTGMNMQELTTRKGYRKILKKTEKQRLGKSSRYTVELNRNNGRRRKFLVSASPIFTGDGSYAGAAVTVTRLPGVGFDT